MKSVCRKTFFLFIVLLFGFSLTAQAAFQSRFDAIHYEPAVDATDYFSVYGSDTLAPWQGHIGFSFDYANRPLQFSGTGGFAGQRQSVIDHMMLLHTHGALGLTDWFEVGVNFPFALYNWFFSDEPVAAPTGNPDKAAMPGDMRLVTKFKAVDINKHRVGLAFIPFVTLPTGDEVRYTGNGNITGGLTTVVDFKASERFNMSLNFGGVLRDDVTRHGVRVDDQLTAAVAANIKLSQNWQVILESFGSTVIRDPFNSNTTPLEAGGGFRYYVNNTGFAFDVGGTGGIIKGVSAPRFRAFANLKWTAPISEPCPEPEPRIQGNKIVLWGKIFYDTAKATIKPVSYPVLDDVVDVLNKHPEITLVEVQGHTDARGSDSYNLKLSQARSESARDYLIQKGISPSRLVAKGYGESQPIAPNSTAEGMSQNRRTEFIILQSSNGRFVSPDQLSTTIQSGVQQVRHHVQ